MIRFVSGRFCIANRVIHNSRLWWNWDALFPQGALHDGRAVSTTQEEENPYLVLKVPRHSSYETVKAAFLKSALLHHPDHSKDSDGTEFVRIRRAFEAIVAQHQAQHPNQNNGVPAKKPWWTKEQPPPVWNTDADFQAWFKQATGEHLSFDMNHATRQEVIRVYRTMSSGGKDKGGYWEMARQLAEREDAFLRSGGGTTAIGGAPAATTTTMRRKRHR